MNRRFLPGRPPAPAVPWRDGDALRLQTEYRIDPDGRVTRADELTLIPQDAVPFTLLAKAKGRRPGGLADLRLDPELLPWARSSRLLLDDWAAYAGRLVPALIGDEGLPVSVTMEIELVREQGAVEFRHSTLVITNSWGRRWTAHEWHQAGTANPPYGLERLAFPEQIAELAADIRTLVARG